MSTCRRLPNAQMFNRNNWDGAKHPMHAKENGCWYANVSEAHAGDQYRFLISTKKGEFKRIDLYARGGIYFYNVDRASTPWGETPPDYGRDEVRQYLRDNALMWLGEYHVDGLRFDCTEFFRTVHGSEAQDIPEG